MKVEAVHDGSSLQKYKTGAADLNRSEGSNEARFLRGTNLRNRAGARYFGKPRVIGV
jgi:hypothetical protein